MSLPVEIVTRAVSGTPSVLPALNLRLAAMSLLCGCFHKIGNTNALWVTFTYFLWGDLMVGHKKCGSLAIPVQKGSLNLLLSVQL